MWLGGLLCTVVLWELLIRGAINLLAAVIITAAFILISLRDKAIASLLVLAFLNVLGDVRRMMDVAFGMPVLDLLLLVGPACAALFAISPLLHLRLRDVLSKAVLILLVVMVLQIFNPLQGGIAIGLSGAVFYIAPILWFWVARQYASPIVVERLLYAVLLPLALGAALLGMYQTFIGFIPFEQAWIDVASKTYHSLYVGKFVRAFGFSVSSQEYATLLAIGSAGSAAAYFGHRRRWSLAFPILVPALVLSSSRTLILKLIVTLAVVWIARRGRQLNALALLRLVLVAVVGLVGVSIIASRYVPSQAKSSATGSAAQNLLAHQTGGLAHPLDQRYSTIGVHSGMVARGIIEGVLHPIGHGLGSTTLGGGKFADESHAASDDSSHTGSSEVDFSDMFISLGLVGGCVYLFVMYAAMQSAVSYTQTVRLGVSLPVLAILTLSLAFWLIAGQYSTSSILFFFIGALAYGGDRQSTVLNVEHEREPRTSQQTNLVAFTPR